jgi:O-antigen/teichoic acid export membrane protein
MRTGTTATASAGWSADVPGETSGAVARSFRNLLGGEAVNKGARFMAAALLARALTPHGFGAFNVAIAGAGIATAATGLGLGEVGGRDAAITPSRSSWIAGRVLTARLIAILSVVFTGLVVTALIAPSKLAVIAAAGAVAIGTASSADWLGRAQQRTRGVAAASAIGGVVAAICGVLVLELGGSNVEALIGFAAAEFVTSLLCWRAVWRSGPPRIGWSGVRPLLQRSWPIAISSVVIYSYYANLDTIILSASHGTVQAGIYSGAYRVFLVVNAVAIFVAYANFPTLSRASTEPGNTSATHTLHSNIVYLFSLGAAVAGIAVLIGGDLLDVMFGHRFHAAGHTFGLLCVGTMWYLIGYPLGYSLIASDRNRRFLSGAAIAGVLSIGLDLALIPSLGMTGAGLANATCFAAGAAVWMIGYGRWDRSLSTVLVGLLACTIAVVSALEVDAVRIPLGGMVLFAGLATAGVYRVRSRPA